MWGVQRRHRDAGLTRIQLKSARQIRCAREQRCRMTILTHTENHYRKFPKTAQQFARYRLTLSRSERGIFETNKIGGAGRVHQQVIPHQLFITVSVVSINPALVSQRHCYFRPG